MTERVDPTRAALLLMDFHTSTFRLVSDPATLLDRAKAARRWAHDAGVQVVHVRVAFTAQDRASIPSRNKSFTKLATDGRFAEGSPDAEIHADLRPAEGEIVTTKTRVGAFSTTNLANHLSARGIDTLILGGIATSGVVLSTLRDAADRDYRLLVLSDCCADADPEVHRVLVDKVFPRQADIVETSDLEGLCASSV